MVFQLGPNMPTTYRIADNSVTAGQSHSIFGFGKRSVKLYASFNPKAVDGTMVLETSSGLKDRHASKIAGLKPVRTNSLRNALYSAGGIKVSYNYFIARLVIL